MNRKVQHAVESQLFSASGEHLTTCAMLDGPVIVMWQIFKIHQKGGTDGE